MSKPAIICYGCGGPTTPFKPVCDECAELFKEHQGYVPCNLCVAKIPRNDKGEHLSAGGGYAGQCSEFEKPQEVQDHG